MELVYAIMDVVDPTSASDSPDESSELNALSARIDGLEGKHVGLYDNAKLAAEPILNVLEEKLEEKYSDITISTYSMEHLNWAKDPDKLAEVGEWARDLDCVIGAIGDCGSCTKFLVWGIQEVEEVGTPAVGLIDEGFELDWRSNAIERDWPLRYSKIPVRAEVQDEDRISEKLTPEAIEAIEDELTQPLTEKERGNADA